jgi:hypothetical protein
MIATAVGSVPLKVVRTASARRYRLRYSALTGFRLTIPRAGSFRVAGEFLEKTRPWMAQQVQRYPFCPSSERQLKLGDEIWLHGQRQQLALDAAGNLTLGTMSLGKFSEVASLELQVGRSLRQLAKVYLTKRAQQLAVEKLVQPAVIRIKDQRTRWGSCSSKKAVNLNWRLIQLPPAVADYIILHEFAHLFEMNHSSRFWRKVRELCPAYEESERWLKCHGRNFLREL